MLKNITYNGHTAIHSDYESPDGDLALSLNLIQEDGAIHPLLPPAKTLSLSPALRVAYIHKTSAFTHYILCNSSTNEFSWIDKNDIDASTLLPSQFNYLYSFQGTAVYNLNSIGNTLVILGADGIHYFLWKDSSYTHLGTHFPECPISFGLQGEVVRTDKFKITFDAIKDSEISEEFSDENKTKISNQVLAQVNRFIAEEATNKGKFLYPFLVRYAYRLYDGTLTMHSAPVLMVASSGIAPHAFCDLVLGQTNDHTDVYITGALHSLDYAVLHQLDIIQLRQWKDIIRSVDIFISAPIYTYDQNGQCKGFIRTDSDLTYSVCRHTNQAVSEADYPLRYQHKGFNYMYSATFEPEKWTIPMHSIQLPARSDEAVREDIRSCSQFYLLKSIKLEQLTTGRSIIPVSEDYLRTLQTREVMTDGYDSHDTLVPRYSYAYNSRLNLAGISKTLNNPCNAGAQFCFTDGYIARWVNERPTYKDGTVTWEVFFFINQDGRDIIVKGDGYELAKEAPLLYLFYPNINAYKAVVVSTGTTPTCHEVTLEQHMFLNGAVYFGGWDNPSSGASYPDASSLSERVIDVPNKIYTSEVNNPFYFPVLGINTIGAGEILGISSAVKALSQGQFGQFPLYAFTTEGVWALEVSSNGTYSARQPVTRDVCINPDSITQIDTAVLFATDRGVMLLSGSNAQCLTDIINSDDTFSLSILPHAAELIEHSSLPADTFEIKPFSEFLSESRITYDYVHQHIILFNPAVRYAYVYSMKSHQWGMIYSDIISAVNSYPEALVMNRDGYLLDFSKTTDEGTDGLLVTRPFSFDDPDTLKTISSVLQRGTFTSGHVQSVLYGSRDLYNWFIISSSKNHRLARFAGTPYKYFRLALVTSMNSHESIRGFSAEYLPRFTNRLR